MTSQILIFGGYLKVRKSLYTQIILWVYTILKDTKTKEFLIGLKVLAWYIHLMISTKNILKFPYPNTCNKNVEILIIDA